LRGFLAARLVREPAEARQDLRGMRDVRITEYHAAS